MPHTPSTTLTEGPDLIQQLRDVNAALLISSVQQQEIADVAVLAEKKLAASEARLRQVLEAARMGTWDLDPKTMTFTSDAKFSEIFGRPVHGLTFDAAVELVHEDDRDGVRTAVNSAMALEGPSSFDIEYRVTHPDASLHWVSAKGGATFLHGRLIGFAGTVADITEHKLDQESKRDEEAMFRVRLEDAVEHRTEELLHANEQLQGFTYTVAHDLRQQIRGININATMLVMDLANSLTPEAKDTLARLIHNSKKLGTFVDDLLEYSRLGSRTPTKSPVDMTELSESISTALIERGACCTEANFKIAEGMVANGDAQMIRVVMENLLENACTYTCQKTHPIIEVGVEKGAFFVRDNGAGFDMQYAHKLFMPFERLHTDSTYPGTGIGLANVKRIVEKHGGKVWATGAPDAGATFYFTMPN